MMLNPYSLVPFTSGALALSVGLVAYRHNPSFSLHRLFFWLCAAVCLWPFSLSVFLNLSDPHAVVFWTKVGHITCTVGPAVFFNFVVTLLNKQHLRRASRLYYVMAGCCLLASWFSNRYFPGGVLWYRWGPYAAAGPLVIWDALIATTMFVVSSVFLFRACQLGKHTLPAVQYNKLRYMTIALAFFSFAMLDYLPKYGIPILPIGSIFIAAFALIVAYAIIRHQLLDVTIAIRRTMVYSVLAAFLTVIYLGFVLVTEKLLQNVMGYRSLIASVVAGCVIAVSFIPLKEMVQRIVDRFFLGQSPVALAEENERLRHEVARSEKLKAVSTLAAGMAHEIKNPLSSIKIFSEYLPERYDDPDFRERFTRLIPHEVSKINGLVQRLLDFAKPAPPKPCAIRLSTLLDETVELLNDALVRKQIRLTRAYTSADAALVDAAQMKQVFLNLLLNSIEAIEKAGAITITTISENGHLHVQVADTGKGIPKKELPQIFDPFYTTKATGTGLGLSVVHGIVKEHGGRVTIDSDVGKGTTVRVILPTAKAQDAGEGN